MKKLYFIFSWICFSIGTIIISAGVTSAMVYTPQALLTLHPESKSQLASSGEASTPTLGLVQGIQTTIETEDARPQVVANFLKRHSSPLTPHDEWGKKLVEIADRNNIDYRLLPAIGMQESNLCKKIPEGSYNCLGFGIHSRGTLTFDSYEANFERAARELYKNYISQGRDTPLKIMQKYTPSSPNGAWANSVTQWMNEMRYDDRTKGREVESEVNVLEFLIPSPTPTPGQ